MGYGKVPDVQSKVLVGSSGKSLFPKETWTIMGYGAVGNSTLPIVFTVIAG